MDYGEISEITVTGDYGDSAFNSPVTPRDPTPAPPHDVGRGE